MGSSLRKELGQARARVEATRSRVGLLMDALTTFNAIQQLNSQKLDPDLLEQAVGSLARDWVNRSGTCIFPQMDRFVLRDDLVIEVARSRKNSGGKTGYFGGTGCLDSGGGADTRIQCYPEAN